jgi:hypothetical protein
MAEQTTLRSEGEALESALDELQKEHSVKEISGWETGFAHLSRALDGLRPGLHLLVGPPAIGKTSFARQLLDQVAMHNQVPGVFFTFTETAKELRIRTLARLSNLDSREIRRGSAFLLHWYGVPKAQYSEAEKLPPSWEKLKCATEEARSWLDLVYLIECPPGMSAQQIEFQLGAVRALAKSEGIFIVYDDCQRLGDNNQPLNIRLPIVVEQLQQAATNLQAPLFAVWPDLGESGKSQPQTWSEKVASADVVLVMEPDGERTKKLIEPNQAITLHIVQNRRGEKGKLAFDFCPAIAKFAESEGN